MPIAITVRQIEMFLMVSNLSSFTRAANAVGISQSALSQSIMQMETNLGIRLFERTKTTVKLTPAGNKFMIHAENLMRDLSLALASLKTEEEPGGKVTIAALSTITTQLLPDVATLFKHQNPNASVLIREGHVDAIVGQVKDGAVDFAISWLYEDDRDIEFQPLLDDCLQFVCALNHPLAGASQVTWEDFRDYDFVAVAKGSGLRAMIDAAIAPSLTLPTALYEVSRVPSILEIVRKGGVVSVVPALSVVDSNVGGALHHCRLTSPEIIRRIGILTSKSRGLSAPARAFHKTLIDVVNTRWRDQYPGIKVLTPPTLEHHDK